MLTDPEALCIQQVHNLSSISPASSFQTSSELCTSAFARGTLSVGGVGGGDCSARIELEHF